MKWYVYAAAFAIMLLAVFAGVDLGQRMSAQSYINGSIDYRNQFSMKTFTYGSTGVVFYHDDYDTTNTHSYQVNLLQVDDFNGLEKKYQVVLNDYILLDTTVGAGSITAHFYINFYDTDNVLKVDTHLVINLVFYSNKTSLTLSAVGALEAAQLEQYFQDKGIRLKIKEVA